MGWESFGVVGFDRGPVLQGRTRILHLQYFFKYVLTYSLHLNSYLVTFLHNTICREQLFCPFLLSGSDFLLNMLFNYHLLYFCTALSLVIMLSSHYYLHKSKTLSQLTQCPFTGTLLLLIRGVTTAVLKASGMHPSISEQLTSFVSHGSGRSMHSLIRNVGQGSNRQHFVGEVLIILPTASTETFLKTVIFGGSDGG